MVIPKNEPLLTSSAQLAHMIEISRSHEGLNKNEEIARKNAPLAGTFRTVQVQSEQISFVLLV